YLAPDIAIVVLAYAAFHAIGLQLAFIGITTAIARRYAGISGLALGIAYAGWRATALAFLASSLVGVAFVWLMTSGPTIVIPARRTRSIESDQAARATGLHETAAPGAVSAGFEPLPVGTSGRRLNVRRTIRTRRFWAFFG